MTVTSLRAAMAGLMIAMGLTTAAIAKDSASRPTMDEIDALCDAVGRPCLEACKAADYTAAQRSGCESTCITAWDDCRASATAKRGSASSNVRKPPVKGVLDSGSPPSRKPVQAAPDMQLKR